MTSWGAIGLGQVVVAEEDYIGASRSIANMTDILGPVAALLLRMGSKAPSIVVAPYNRMRNSVVLASAQLLGEAYTFVEAQTTAFTRTRRWTELGIRLERGLLPAFCLPHIEQVWSRTAEPDGWRETVLALGHDWPWFGETDRANEIVEAYAARLPQIRPDGRFVMTARYGGGPVSLGDIKIAPVVIGWLIMGAWAIIDSIGLFTSTSDDVRANPLPIVTPAVDTVNGVRDRFERSFMPAVYQPVRAAAKIVARTGGEPEATATEMYGINPIDTEPALSGSWDGTFGFGGTVPAPPESEGFGWGSALLVGAAALLLAVLVMGDT